jgi:hypothetical protein
MKTIGMECSAIDMPFMRRPFMQLLTRVYLPQANHTIITDADQRLSIVGTLDGSYPAFMGVNRSDDFGLSIGDRPPNQTPVASSGNKEIPVL